MPLSELGPKWSRSFVALEVYDKRIELVEEYGADRNWVTAQGFDREGFDVIGEPNHWGELIKNDSGDDFKTVRVVWENDEDRRRATEAIADDYLATIRKMHS